MEVELVKQERGVMDALMQMYNNRIQHFRIGESTLVFMPKDVACTMGLRCDRDVVSF